MLHVTGSQMVVPYHMRYTRLHLVVRKSLAERPNTNWPIILLNLKKISLFYLHYCITRCAQKTRTVVNEQCEVWHGDGHAVTLLSLYAT